MFLRFRQTRYEVINYMERSKKMVRPKAINPRGFRDNFHSYLKKRDEVLEVVNRVYELYGLSLIHI